MVAADLFSAPPSRYYKHEPEHNADLLGARKLKERIETYWRERGYGVQVTLIPRGFDMKVRCFRYDLRSNLVNGLPTVPVATLPSLERRP